MNCDSIEDFITKVQQHKVNDNIKPSTLENDLEQQAAQAIFQIYNECNLSHSQRRKFSEAINALKPQYVMPLDSRTLANCDINSIKHYPKTAMKIEWPESWEMEWMEQNSFPPIEIYYRDPIELISYLLIDPQIMFEHKDHVKFNYTELTEVGPNGELNQAQGDVMTTKWVELSEKEIIELDPEGHILPIIFYSDGVCVSDSNVKNKITPVICSIGNFSDELMNKIFAKCVISYLPNFNSHSKEVLVQHLKETLDISYTAAEKNVRLFELYVERTFWTAIVKIIKNYAYRGVKLNVLGQGIKIFYPRIAFICGDDPSQHRMSGLSEGMAKYGCTHCIYKTSSGLVYDPVIDIPRDVGTISRKCAVTEPFMEILINGGKLGKDDKMKIKELSAYNIHPYINPFFSAPMGCQWDIYKAVPPDILHLFCAGLMKALASWVLIIISSISSIRGGKCNCND